MIQKKSGFTTRLTRDDVAGLVEALIEGLKSGCLKVPKSNEILELEVPRVVDFEVEASLDEEGARFALEISWRPNRAENPDMPSETPEASGHSDTAEQGDGPNRVPACTASPAPKKRGVAKSGGSARKTALGIGKKSRATRSKL